MLAVFGSGINCMSEASMPFQPAIDEPSKAWPETNLSSSKCETGTETCCSLPRVSVKRKSTNLTSFSCTNFITSATVLDINGLLVCGANYRVGSRSDQNHGIAEEGKQVLCRETGHANLKIRQPDGADRAPPLCMPI